MTIYIKKREFVTFLVLTPVAALCQNDSPQNLKCVRHWSTVSGSKVNGSIVVVAARARSGLFFELLVERHTDLPAGMVNRCRRAALTR